MNVDDGLEKIHRLKKKIVTRKWLSSTFLGDGRTTALNIKGNDPPTCSLKTKKIPIDNVIVTRGRQ